MTESRTMVGKDGKERLQRDMRKLFWNDANVNFLDCSEGFHGYIYVKFYTLNRTLDILKSKVQYVLYIFQNKV